MLNKVCKTTAECPSGESCLFMTKQCSKVFRILPDMKCNATSDCLGYQQCSAGMCKTYSVDDLINRTMEGGGMRPQELYEWTNYIVEGNALDSQRISKQRADMAASQGGPV